MIKLEDLTPAIYYDESRDFQFIGRLFDIVLNSVKTNADNLYNLPIGKNMNERLLNLLALTLGFQSKHYYNSKQLLSICSVLPKALKNKGSLNAIIVAVNALLSAEGIEQALDYSIDDERSITLYLPPDLTDLSLLKDLLVYILPAGVSCKMVKEIRETHPISTEMSFCDVAEVHIESAPKLNKLLKVKDEGVRNEMKNGRPGIRSGVLPNISAAKDDIDKEKEADDGQ